MTGKSYAYPVTSVFKALQGEGHFVGYPCVFIRLAGCSVGECSIRKECDEAPWKATETLSGSTIANRAFVLSGGGGGIAVVSGGEPTDHDLLPLVEKLRRRGLRVHLETSGVRSIEGFPLDWVTVSPKRFDYVQRTGHTLKVVVRPEWGWREVNDMDGGSNFFHRYLQPLTLPDGSTNLKQVTEMLLSEDNPGWRWALSTQAHKTWGIR